MEQGIQDLDQVSYAGLGSDGNLYVDKVRTNWATGLRTSPICLKPAFLPRCDCFRG